MTLRHGKNFEKARFKCKFFNSIMIQFSPNFVPKVPMTDNKSAPGDGLAPNLTECGLVTSLGDKELGQIMACCLLEASLNTLRPRQDGRYFPDDIFKCIFLNENIWISINVSLKFVPEGRIDNIPALVEIMAWRRSGDKPLSEPMMVKFTDAYMRHSASMS